MKNFLIVLKAISLLWKNRKQLSILSLEIKDVVNESRKAVADGNYSANDHRIVCREVADVVNAIQGLEW